MDKWDVRFMEMAHLVSTWTSCYTEGRAIGAVIVKDKRVMTTGYNGAPAGLPTCREKGECLRRKLGVARNDAERVRSCQTCYGIDIQYDNVLACREKLTAIAVAAGVDVWTARLIFARNVIHGDMLFFPMIARIYDWKNRTWTTLEEMTKD